MFALFLATIVAAGQPVTAAACPASQTRVLLTSEPIAPEGIHPTNRRVRLLLDVGSEGELRRAAIVESSGDAVFDAATLDAAKRFRFAPQTQGCISTSSVVPEDFNVPLISLVRPVPGSTGPAEIPSMAPAAAICGAPFVQLTGLDIPDLRQARERSRSTLRSTQQRTPRGRSSRIRAAMQKRTPRQLPRRAVHSTPTRCRRVASRRRQRIVWS